MNVLGSANNLRGKVNIGNEVDLAQAKCSVLQTLLEEAGKSDSPLSYAKLSEIISHLCTRVSNPNEYTSLNEISNKSYLN